MKAYIYKIGNKRYFGSIVSKEGDFTSKDFKTKSGIKNKLKRIATKLGWKITSYTFRDNSGINWKLVKNIMENKCEI